jgi:DNA polymerase III subunit gamma/tau
MILGMLRQNEYSPAYLFSGLTGSGKTSLARLMAKSIQCTNRQGADPCGTCDICRSFETRNNPDFEYVNGANQRSLEYINDRILPFLRAAPIRTGHRIMVIDEAHQYTRDSISPFLIFLENMPKHAILIFCTTEPDKVLPEIVNRCTPVIFSRLSEDEIVDRVCTLVPELDREPVSLLAQACGGCFRSVWSVLDSWKGLDPAQPLTEELIQRLLGSVPRNERAKLWEAVRKGNAKVVKDTWKRWDFGGAIPDRVGNDLVNDLIDMAVTNTRFNWQQALAVLSGCQVTKASNTWLPALMLLTGNLPDLPEPQQVNPVATLGSVTQDLLPFEVLRSYLR